MEHKRYAAILKRAAPAVALVLTAFRVLTLTTGFEENGLLPRGSWFLPATLLLAALGFGGLWFLSARLNRLPGTEACFSQQPALFFLRLAASLLVLVGSLSLLLASQDLAEPVETAVGWVGLFSGLLLGWTALSPVRSRRIFWARLLPALYTGAALVLRFRSWSHDPMVIHIAPILLAWTCCMVEMTLLTGFPLNAGHRRSAVLFGLSTGAFACMTLPDYLLGLRTGLPDLLSLLGLALWCVAAALDLLRGRVQEEQRPAEPESEQNEEKSV